MVIVKLQTAHTVKEEDNIYCVLFHVFWMNVHFSRDKQTSINVVFTQNRASTTSFDYTGAAQGAP